MTTTTLRYQKVPPVILLLAIAAMAIAAIALAMTGPHAEFKHGNDALLARHCGENPQWYFYNPQTDRWALVCWVPELGRFGVSIVDSAGKEITSFIKNKMTKLDEVVRYLTGRGYELFGP